MKNPFYNLHFIISQIKKLPWLVASRAFLVITILILVSLLAGGYLFYQYAVLIETKSQDIVEKNSAFSYTGYKEILNQWKAREDVLQASKDKEYRNPFIPSGQPVKNNGK